MLSDNEGDPRLANAKLLIAHSTAAPNGEAWAVARNMKRAVNQDGAYVHLVVDDKSIYLVGSLGYVAWGAGAYANAKSPVQIELCEFTDKARALKAYQNYVNLIREMCDTYGINKTLDSSNKNNGVKTHNWVSYNLGNTDHSDPIGYLTSIGISQARFASDIANGYSANATAPSDTIPAGFNKEDATFINGDTPIASRIGAPSTSAKFGAWLKPSETFHYDSAGKVGDYTWVHARYRGQDLYLPVRVWHADGTSTPWGTFK